MAIKFHQIKEKWFLFGLCQSPIQNNLEFTERITENLSDNIPFLSKYSYIG